MGGTIFVIHTTRDAFADWLEHFTKNAPSRCSLGTPENGLTLQPARRGYNPYGPMIVEMGGRQSDTDADGITSTWSVDRLIWFELVPLDNERVEVTGYRSRSFTEGYFEWLLAEIGKRWPEGADEPMGDVESAEPGDETANDVQPKAYWPSTEWGRARYRERNKVMLQLEKRAKEQFEQGVRKSSSAPTIDEYREVIALNFGKRPSAKTIERILKNREVGRLPDKL